MIFLMYGLFSALMRPRNTDTRVIISTGSQQMVGNFKWLSPVFQFTFLLTLIGDVDVTEEDGVAYATFIEVK